MSAPFHKQYSYQLQCSFGYKRCTTHSHLYRQKWDFSLITQKAQVGEVHSRTMAGTWRTRFSICGIFFSYHLSCICLCPLPSRIPFLRTVTWKRLAPFISGTNFKFCQLPPTNSRTLSSVWEKNGSQRQWGGRGVGLIQNRDAHDWPPSSLLLQDIMLSEAREDSEGNLCPGRKNLPVDHTDRF